MITVANYCVGCAFCMLVCPEEAIQVLGRPEIDMEKCDGCQRCVRNCPVEAIRFVKE